MGIVRSLDGIVDNNLSNFLTPSGIDHLGAYIRNRNIDYIFASQL